MVRKRINFEDCFNWLQAKSLEEKGKKFERLELDFDEHDSAVIDDYQYKTVISSGERKILGSSTITPHAGEIIQ